MLQHLDLQNVLVLDIETVSGQANFEALSPTMQYLWEIKSNQVQKRSADTEPLSPNDNYPQMAGIYAEFGKIVCISVGIFRRNKDTGELEFHVKSFYSDDERQLLLDFANLLEKHYNNPKKHYLCGHNIREFDIPYICRRMIIQGMNLPDVIDLYGKKPWETEHLLDTLALWRFGDYKNFTSLKLLCGVFDIPTPKDDIDGSEVGKTYWEEKDLDRIEVYCKKDVVATAQLLLRFKLEKLLREDQIFLR
jgi:predicted PolB exonuclease-like 3'-5' exonuclease